MLGSQKIMTEAPRDPRRAALGEAIAARDRADSAVDQTKAASERANGLVEDAERHAEAVKIALASARDGREARLRQAVEGGDVIEAAVSRREARFTEIDAADELEAARKVRVAYIASLSDAQDDANRAQQRVESAVAPILNAEIDRLLVETTRLSDALHGKYEVLFWLRGLLLPVGDERMRIDRILPPPTPPGVRPTVYKPPVAWIEAKAALQVDASAPLPA